MVTPRRIAQDWVLGAGGLALLWLAMLLLGDGPADTRILRSLRSPDDLSRPIGPHWLELMMLDLTAVGGPTVLSLVVLIIAGFLFIERRHRMALGVLVTSFGGMLVTAMLKQMYDRPRPSVVPHLREVTSSSFPSGHAMQSAIVYLTLGALLMRIVEGLRGTSMQPTVTSAPDSACWTSIRS